MRKTPWVKPSQGSLPSDRLVRPANNSGSRTPPSRGKNRDHSKEPPKSKEVIRLEVLLHGLNDPIQNKTDPHGGCFCQARIHPLSTYTPLCRNCGLILCELHQPYYICPNSGCSSLLITAPARSHLVTRLEVQIAEAVAKEEEARHQAVREAREAAGAFPVLSGVAVAPGGGGALRSHPVNQTHKVLSLNSKTRKVVVASYTPPSTSSRSSSLSGKRGGDAENEDAPDVGRIAAPSKEIEAVKLESGLGVYIPPEREDVPVVASSSKRKKKKVNAKVEGV